ncbi:MAG: ATP-binding protein [Lachnospiraceae bacterium]|nr:ATP-binding protein [Lachnospiraceae bacterium]
MYCILVAGMPASGKSTMAKALAEKWKLPVVSKDSIKELLYDNIGFQSRAEKVNLGIASMEIMYYVAGQLMKAGQPFILENNFEHSSEPGIKTLLEKYQYSALTITLTGDIKVFYQRFLERDISPDRHRGHVVNDCYPEKKERSPEEIKAASISYEDYAYSVEKRGFDAFFAGSRQIKVDTTDFSKIDMEELFSQIAAWKEEASIAFFETTVL